MGSKNEEQRLPAALQLEWPKMSRCPKGFDRLDQASFFFVESLKGRYKGQNPIALVARKMTAKRPRMMATVPEMESVK